MRLRNTLVILGLSLIYTASLGQERIIGTYSEESLTRVLESIQTQSEAKIYFNRNLTDTLVYSGSFDSQDVLSALESIITGGSVIGC